MRRILILLALCLPASATHYYVSSAGSDSNNGTSTSTPFSHAPGMSGCGANCTTALGVLAAGDIVSLRCGDTFRNQRISGLPTVGSPGYTYNSYGPCAGIVRPTPNVSSLPKVTASTALTNGSFTLSGGKTFTYQIALTTNPGGYSAENGVALLFQSSIATVEAAACTFWWSANVYYVHPCDNSNPTSNGKVYETSTAFDALEPKNWMTVDGIDLEFGTGFVIGADHAQHLTIKNSIVRFGPTQAIWTSSNSPLFSDFLLQDSDLSYANDVTFVSGNNITIVGNVFHDAVRCTEIYDVAAQDSQNILIGVNADGTPHGNYYHDCGALQGNPQQGEVNAGVLLGGQSFGSATNFNQGSVRYNLFQNMHGRGIDAMMGGCGASKSDISYNFFINTQAGNASSDAIAIDVSGPCVQVLNNTVLNWVNICIQTEPENGGGAGAELVKNNICLNNTGIPSWFNFASSTATPPINTNNFYWDVTGGAGQSKYSCQTVTKTFTQWQASTCNSSNEQEINPNLTNPTGLNGRLSKSSPAIDAGVNLGTTYQNGLNSHTVFPFGTLNQNSYGTGWDIGAFIFLPGNAWFSAGAQ